jgi:hypothetical protein
MLLDRPLPFARSGLRVLSERSGVAGTRTDFDSVHLDPNCPHRYRDPPKRYAR